MVHRLEALKKSSTFEKDTSPDPVSRESSVQKITQNLQEQNNKTYSKQVSLSEVGSETAVVNRRQKLLNKASPLIKQQSTDKIIIDTGLVRNVKERLQAA